MLRPVAIILCFIILVTAKPEEFSESDEFKKSADIFENSPVIPIVSVTIDFTYFTVFYVGTSKK